MFGTGNVTISSVLGDESQAGSPLATFVEQHDSEMLASFSRKEMVLRPGLLLGSLVELVCRHMRLEPTEVPNDSIFGN